MAKDYHFGIWQGGIEVVSGQGADLERVKAMMVQYATQYVQDGPITITGSPELAPDANSSSTQEKKL